MSDPRHERDSLWLRVRQADGTDGAQPDGAGQVDGAAWLAGSGSPWLTAEGRASMDPAGTGQPGGEAVPPDDPALESNEVRITETEQPIEILGAHGTRDAKRLDSGVGPDEIPHE